MATLKLERCCGLRPLLLWGDRRRLGPLLELESRRGFRSLQVWDGIRGLDTLV